ncbi:MAG: hypothetical protein LBU15_02760 [Rickettsiales bacterium]|nr:hypothetical protein [Rickettsiales bacterium]
MPSSCPLKNPGRSICFSGVLHYLHDGPFEEAERPLDDGVVDGAPI